MFDFPDLPLALIMEEILEWDKPKKEEEETSLNNCQTTSDNTQQDLNK